LLGFVLGEEAPGDAGGDEEEEPFAGVVPEAERQGKQRGAIDGCECVGRFAAVEHPDGNEVERVEEGSGAGESCPERVVGLAVYEVADGGGDPAGEGPGEGDLRDLAASDAEGGPANVSSEAREEDWHLSGKAAALDVDEVAQLMDEDADGDAEAVAPSEDTDVEDDEEGEAEEELELEDQKEGALEFEQEQGYGSEWAELFDPVGGGAAWVWRFEGLMGSLGQVVWRLRRIRQPAGR